MDSFKASKALRHFFQRDWTAAGAGMGHKLLSEACLTQGRFSP
jgi:hypothetical protein